MNTAAFAPGEPREHMQITAQNNQLPGSTCCTGNEHRNIHGNRYVCDYRCVRDLKHGQDQEGNAERGMHHVFHESTSISGAKTSGCYITKSIDWRSEEHTSELQSLTNLVCRLLLEKKKKIN